MVGGATPVRASGCASACMLCVATGAKVTVAELLGGLGEGRVRGVANLRKRLATSGHAQHQLRPPPGKPQTEKVRREGGKWAGKEGGRKWGRRERGREGRREGSTVVVVSMSPVGTAHRSLLPGQAGGRPVAADCEPQPPGRAPGVSTAGRSSTPPIPRLTSGGVPGEEKSLAISIVTC